MKIYQIFPLAFLALSTFVISSCVRENFEDIPPAESGESENEFLQELLQVQISEDFNFETHRQVRVVINDPTPNVKYDVFAYNDTPQSDEEITVINEGGEEETISLFATDILNNRIFSGVPSRGTLEQTVVLPSHFNQLYVRRNNNFVYTAEIFEVNSDVVTINHNSLSGRDFFNDNAVVVGDILYGINGAGNLFQVDREDGSLTLVSQMPDGQGSFTLAMDQPNQTLYTIGRFNPNPLYKYDVVNDTWDIVANLRFGGPRLDYRADEGLLYFSNSDFIRTIDPTNGNTISQWDINNLDNTRGGDLIFAPDGTLFISTFGGLYRLELNAQNSYDATRISGENLPFTPTSMTFDIDGNLWLADAQGDSSLIIMDTVTGGFEYRFGADSNSGVTYGRAINDLTTFRIIEENPQDTDTDGDGIVDRLDDFPDDPEKADEIFTPSEFGWGSVAFEDLWPFLGDYDFNDIVVNYRVVAIANAQNDVVELQFNLWVSSNGGSFTNGFGIEIEGLSPDMVESVTGPVLTENYINLNPNGTEQGQQNAVIITHDNNANLLDQTFLVTVRLTEPIPSAQLGAAPFNPFLIRNAVREHEIHLPNRSATSLGNPTPDLPGVIRDADGDYQTETGLPWAINIIHNFRAPRERIPVNEAYNFFINWAASGGTEFPDWYTDRAGYRNTSKLKD